MLEPIGYLGLITNPSNSSNDLNSGFEKKDLAMAKAKRVEINDQMYVEQDTITEPKKNNRHQSATFAFWDGDFEALSVLQRLMRAKRETKFLLHLDTVLETVPFFLFNEDQLFLVFFCRRTRKEKV